MSMTMIVTDAGRAALINAAGNGTAPVTISHFGISAAAVTPLPSATALPGEIKRIGAIAGATTANDTIHLVVRDASADVYTMRSWALYLADGTLFGIFGQADPILAKTATSIMMEAIDIRFADIDANDLTFGDTNFLNPAATTEIQGVVELATNAETITGADDQRAVTPKGLAALYTAGNVLAKLLTVDGSGSGVDSDFLRGLTPEQVVSYARIVAGLGYAPAIGNGNIGNADINWITRSGMYRFDQPVNGPAGISWGQLLVVHGASETIAQIIFSPSDGRSWTRTGSPDSVGGVGGWSPWRLNVDADFLSAAAYDVNGATMRRNGHHLWGQDNLTHLGQLINSPGYINTHGRAYPRNANNGGDINFYWNDPGGQPPYVWGGDDGINMYVYATARLSVANADTVDGYHADALVKYADFTGGNQSLGVTGYQKLPGGEIVQWGRLLMYDDTYASVTFPIAFPNMCTTILSGCATEVGNYNAQANGPLPYSATKEGASFWNAAYGAAGNNAWWRAWGF